MPSESTKRQYRTQTRREINSNVSEKFHTLLSHVTICPFFFMSPQNISTSVAKSEIKSDSDMRLIWNDAVTLLPEIFISMLCRVLENEKDFQES